MGDPNAGRIYRLTPKGHKGYKVPEVKLDTKEGVLAAFGSCNLATRQAANTAFIENDKVKELDVFNEYAGRNSKIDPLISARAWAGAATHAKERDTRNHVIRDSLKSDESIAIHQVGLRLLIGAMQRGEVSDPEAFADFADQFNTLSKLPNTALHREALLALPHFPLKYAVALIYHLAKLYDGQDIFYRAALNIACGTDPERRDKVLADFEKHFPEWNDKVADLVWELRPKSMLPKMEKLLVDPKVTAKQKARIVDIIASSDDANAGKIMLTMLASDASPEAKTRALESLKMFLPTKWKELLKSAELKEVSLNMLKHPETMVPGLQLIAAAGASGITFEVDHVSDFARPKVTSSRGIDRLHSPAVRREALATLSKMRIDHAVDYLNDFLCEKENPFSLDAATALGSMIVGRGTDPISQQALGALKAKFVKGDGEPKPLLQAIAASLASSRAGTEWLLETNSKNQIPKELLADVGRLLRNSPFPDLRNKAALAFPAPGKLDPKKLPPIAELAKRVGNAENGKAVMAKSLTSEVQCLKCHTVRGQGGSIGPDLSMVGKKATKENLYESMFTPSKAIADQYLSWKLDGEDGQSITGLLVGETPTMLTIRDANGKDYQFPVKGTERKKQLTSIMPEALVATLTEDELVDVVEYLSKLQTPSLTPDVWKIMGPFPKAKLDDEIATFVSQTIRSGSNGHFDLAAFYKDKAPNSMSVLAVNIESPADQEAMILLGTDDGCRLFVNGEKVFGHDRTEAAKPERDSVTVKLKKGENAIRLKVSNGDNPHGFYFTITSKEELKLVK